MAQRRRPPKSPIPAVSAIITQDDQILLVRRGSAPAIGRWSAPGGAIELGETAIDAVKREVLEETGLEVEVADLILIVDRILHDDAGRIQYHYVILDFLAWPVGGALRPGDDAGDARWVSLSELDDLDVIEQARDIAQKLLTEHQLET